MKSKGKSILKVIGIIFITFGFASILDNQKDFKVFSESKQPRLPITSDNAIDIIYPENKTYTTPMSGYYPATYGFENDKNGLSPYDWDDTCETNAYAQVIDSAGNHKKVLECSSTSGSASSVNLENIFVAQNIGTLELWMMKSSSYEGGPAVLIVYGVAAQSLITLIIDDDSKENIEYINPSGIYTDIGYSGYSDDKWFHIRMEWDCNSDTYSIWIDNIEYLNNIGFQNSLTDTAIESIKLYSFDLSNPALFYIDAVGYSWDPYYNIGDNLHKGLKLNFETTFNVNRSLYSLDGQSNKIAINCSIIPILDEGLHTIQIYANDSLGIWYLSDIKYFSLSNYHTPSSFNLVIEPDEFYRATWIDLSWTASCDADNYSIFLVDYGETKLLKSGIRSLEYSLYMSKDMRGLYKIYIIAYNEYGNTSSNVYKLLGIRDLCGGCGPGPFYIFYIIALIVFIAIVVINSIIYLGVRESYLQKLISYKDREVKD